MNKTKQRIKELEKNIKNLRKNGMINDVQCKNIGVNFDLTESNAKLQATKQTLKEVEEVIDKVSREGDEFYEDVGRNWVYVEELKIELGLEKNERRT